MNAFSRLVLGLVLAGSACAAPTDPGAPEPTGRLELIGVLDPGLSEQLISVRWIDDRARGPVTAELAEWHGDRFVTVATVTASDCARGAFRFGQCLRIPAAVRAGALYEVRVSAPGTQTATAVTRVPADFEIAAVSSDRLNEGGLRFSATWTASQHAYRYLTSVRQRRTDPCYWDECFQSENWVDLVAGLGAETRLDAAQSRDVGFGLDLRVAAVPEALVRYLQSGSGGRYPALPTTNVTGGFGLVSSWNARVAALTGPAN
ncbi:MAG: hypothetical protein AB7S39_02020 [Gemmatimonadales bacterium]